jgi:hypothetical protein
VVGVEQRAEVRRIKQVEGVLGSGDQSPDGVGARETVGRLLAAQAPPRYSRAPAESIVDPFKHWICEQLHARHWRS